ncbi:transglycosylase family protein [Streptomyces sp. NPDC008313]|uniref:LysM peptidoglycan-binding domain-containing protein n=1 Tax=Streptomyces sp. NPDC008313 TaxID=3364826 RepID=UPI0036E4C883
MLSGNGRHRRPRQAPALIVAAGVTGSAIAIPLLGATSASAAGGPTWDQVAECESGGTWSADNGNGYYGGLQITQANWEKYGGLAYAQRADQASRSQQIAVAEAILDDQGVAAWPTCGLIAGLGKDSSSAGVDTGVAGDSSSGTGDSSGSSGSSDSSDSSEPSDSGLATSPDSTLSDPSSGADGDSEKSDGSSDADGDAKTSGDAKTDGSKGDDSDKSGENDESSDASGSDGTSSGRHRGGSADEGTSAGPDSATEDRTGEPSGRHASRDAGASREAADGSYVVRSGDSLSGIADSFGVEGGWSELYAANKQTVGTDPDLILPGQSLAVGAESDEK